MNGQDWPVGTVATATVQGVEGVRVMRAIAHREEAGPYWASPELVGNWSSHDDRDVTGVRPLVVLDLDDTVVLEEMGARRNEHQRLVDMIREAADEFWSLDAAALARKLADQIEAQTKPPAPTFRLGDKVRYVGGRDTLGLTWIERRDSRHLGIVVQVNDDTVRVYDTVENDWWHTEPHRIVPFEDAS